MPSHGENMASSPLGSANKSKELVARQTIDCSARGGEDSGRRKSADVSDGWRARWIVGTRTVLDRAPLGEELVGDLSMGGAASARIRCWSGDVAVGHGDEEVRAELFDRAFPLDPCRMGGGRGRSQGPVEFGFEASPAEVERVVVPCVAPLHFVASHADEVTKGRREDAVALIDDILALAQEMGEKGFLVLGPAAWAT